MKLNSNEAPEFVNVKIRSVQKHILVVDDDGFMLSMYASRSRRAGYAIETDRDGEQGWQSLSTINDALLLTDNDMPRPTVIEMTERLRGAGMTLPVIIATGSLELFDGKAVGRLGETVLLHKPFMLNELLTAVLHALPLRSMVLESVLV